MKKCFAIITGLLSVVPLEGSLSAPQSTGVDVIAKIMISGIEPTYRAARKQNPGIDTEMRGWTWDLAVDSNDGCRLNYLARNDGASGQRRWDGSVDPNTLKQIFFSINFRNVSFDDIEISNGQAGFKVNTGDFRRINQFLIDKAELTFFSGAVVPNLISNSLRTSFDTSVVYSRQRVSFYFVQSDESTLVEGFKRVLKTCS